MNLEPNKFYRTRDGRKAEVYRVPTKEEWESLRPKRKMGKGRLTRKERLRMKRDPL